MTREKLRQLMETYCPFLDKEENPLEIRWSIEGRGIILLHCNIIIFPSGFMEEDNKIYALNKNLEKSRSWKNNIVVNLTNDKEILDKCRNTSKLYKEFLLKRKQKRIENDFL